MTHRNSSPLSIIFAACLCVASWNCKRDSAKNAEYPTAPARKGNMELLVSAPGRVEPEAVIEIKSKASGEIMELPFQEGATVDKGDLIARLDPQVEQRLLSQARARMKTAEASLEKARISADGVRALVVT
jgi:macrolide-specific efflux system membrane fusion protein